MECRACLIYAQLVSPELDLDEVRYGQVADDLDRCRGAAVARHDFPAQRAIGDGPDPENRWASGWSIS